MRIACGATVRGSSGSGAATSGSGNRGGADRRRRAARAGRLGVPTVVIGDRMFDGFGTHREEIEALLRD